MIRHLVFLKNGALEFKRILHPRAFIRMKLDGQLIQGKTITHILVFLLFYLIIFITSSLLLTFYMDGFEQPFISAIGAAAACLSNVGPAVGDFGPVYNFSGLSSTPKIFLSFLMIVGRLELFTILILFTRYFWKNN